MTIERFLRTGLIAGLLAGMPAVVPSAFAADEAPAPATAETFSGTIQMVEPAPGSASLRVTVTRWTTDEERARLAEALKGGGTPALVKALSGHDNGFVQIDANLKLPIRYAVVLDVPEGRRVRIATERPMLFSELLKSANTLDFPIGMVEFTLPAEGKGNGYLIAASQVTFDDAGHIELKTTPIDTGGPNKLVDVEREKPKSGKTEKKEEPKSEKKEEPKTEKPE